MPCAIIECERAEQAASFKAINNNTTRLHSIQVYQAGVVAGDPSAVRIAATCKAAGITPCRLPKTSKQMLPGETMAVRAIGRAVEKFGDGATVATLSAIRNSGEGNAGLLSMTIIYGSCEVVAGHPAWWKNQKALTAAFDEVDLGATYDEAVSVSAQMHGVGVLNQFESRLASALAEQFKETVEPALKPQARPTPAPKAPTSAKGTPKPAPSPAPAPKPQMPQSVRPSITAAEYKGIKVDVIGGIIEYRGKIANRLRPPLGLLAALLSRGSPEAIDRRFLIGRLWAGRRMPPEADQLLDGYARELGDIVAPLSLAIKNTKGVGIALGPVR